MKKLLLLSVLFCTSLFYSQKKKLDFDQPIRVKNHYPKEEYPFMLKVQGETKDADYRVVHKVDHKELPLWLELVVKGRFVTVEMKISNADDTTKELNFDKIKFNLGDKIIEYKVSRWGNTGNVRYAVIKVDNKLAEMLDYGANELAIIGYTWEGKIEKGYLYPDEELDYHDKILLFLQIMSGNGNFDFFN